MLYINKITNAPQQDLNLTGIPNVNIDMALRYLPRMKLWSMDLTWNSISANGIIITTSPNMLRSFRHIFPFGMTCLTTNGLDPYNIDDFAAQAANLYLLTAADVAELEAGMFV